MLRCSDGSGNVPYVDDSGCELFILAGTEDGTPDLVNRGRPRATAGDVICEICGLSMKAGALARHHIGAHLHFDSSWQQRPTFPCGFCGMRPVAPFTAAATMVSGVWLPDRLEKGPVEI